MSVDERILSELKEADGPLSPKGIAEGGDLSHSYVRKRVRVLDEKGKVRSVGGGKYVSERKSVSIEVVGREESIDVDERIIGFGEKEGDMKVLLDQVNGPGGEPWIRDGEWVIVEERNGIEKEGYYILGRGRRDQRVAYLRPTGSGAVEEPWGAARKRTWIEKEGGLLAEVSSSGDTLPAGTGETTERVVGRIVRVSVDPSRLPRVRVERGET